MKRTLEQTLVDNGTDPRQQMALMVCQAVCRLQMDPEQSMDVYDLALKLNMKVDTLREVLSSPRYREVMAKAVDETCLSLIGRNTAAIGKEIVNNPKADPRLRLQAQSALTGTMRALVAAVPRQDQNTAESALAEEVKRLNSEAAKLHKPKLKYEVACQTAGSAQSKTMSGSEEPSSPPRRKAASSSPSKRKPRTRSATD